MAEESQEQDLAWRLPEELARHRLLLGEQPAWEERPVSAELVSPA